MAILATYPLLSFGILGDGTSTTFSISTRQALRNMLPTVNSYTDVPPLASVSFIELQPNDSGLTPLPSVTGAFDSTGTVLTVTFSAALHSGGHYVINFQGALL